MDSFPVKPQRAEELSTDKAPLYSAPQVVLTQGKRSMADVIWVAFFLVFSFLFIFEAGKAGTEVSILPSAEITGTHAPLQAGTTAARRQYF